MLIECFCCIHIASGIAEAAVIDSPEKLLHQWHYQYSGMLQPVGSQRVGHDRVTPQQSSLTLWRVLVVAGWFLIVSCGILPCNVSVSRLLHVGILFPWVRTEPASAAMPRAPGKSLRDTTIPFYRLGKTRGGEDKPRGNTDSNGQRQNGTPPGFIPGSDG